MRSAFVVAIIVLSVVATVHASDPRNLTQLTAGNPRKFKITGFTEPQTSWTLFKQCDSRWANQELGTCSGVSICAAGCAMSSVAMILSTKGVSTNPSILNDWLKGHGGYADGCDIYWGTVDQFGKTSFQGIETADYGTVCNGVSAGHGIIANVNGGAHWVLVTGCDGNGNYYVNDPGYNRNSYPASAVLREAVYH